MFNNRAIFYKYVLKSYSVRLLDVYYSDSYEHRWLVQTIYHYRTPVVCRVSETLGKIYKTLDKWFVECNTRRTALAKNSDGKANFAECLLSGTRQSLCECPTLGKAFAECPTLGKVETEKTRKNGIFTQKKWNFFLSMEAPTGQRPPIFDIFRVKFVDMRY